MRTLVIRFSALGDLVLTLPALGDLSACGGEVHFLTLDRFASLLAPLPWIERVWTLDAREGFAGLRRLAAELRPVRFDAVLDLHDNLRSRGLRALLAGSVPRWIRSERDPLRRRLMVAAPDPFKSRLRARPYTPVVERHREAALRLTGSPPARERRYAVDPTTQAKVNERLAELGLAPTARPLGLAPGAAWPQKAWPRFPEFITALPADLPLLLLGGPGEKDLCEEAAAAAKGPAAVLAGARPLPELAAALRRCRGLVSGDSGLAHLAEACGRPVCVLFGPTVPEFGFAPRRPGSLLVQRELSCRPCSLHGGRPCRFGDLRCLAGLEPEALLEELAAEGWLG